MRQDDQRITSCAGLGDPHAQAVTMDYSLCHAGHDTAQSG
jgi:hypothetical protein